MGLLIKASAYRPESPDEKIEGISVLLPLQDRDGFVFLLARTRKENEDTDLLLEILSDHTHRLVDSFGKEANAQYRFEQFLGALNETLADQVKEGRWNVPIEDLHAIVGIATGDQMFLSGAGELTSLFLHRTSSQRYQVFNLFRSIQTEKALPTWEKAFAVVLDGDLHEGDVFCVTNKELRRMIDPDELNTILTTLPPVSAVEKVRQYFPHKDTFQLIVLKAQMPGVVLQTKESDHRSSISVSDLVETEQETEHLLEDQRPKLNVVLSKAVSAILNRIAPQEGSVRQSSKNIDRFKRLALTGTKFLWKHTRRTTKASVHHAKRLSSESGRKEVLSSAKSVKSRVASLFSNTKSAAKQIPRSTKYLIGGLVLAIIVFGFGISTLSRSQARSAEQEAYQEQVTQLEELIERAAGAVIYKDEDQARSLYGNALALLEALPTDTEERLSASVEYQKDIQSALDEIRHLVTIPNPPLLADLSSVTDGVFGSSLVKSSEALYVFGTDGSIYELNRSEKRFSVAAQGDSSTIAQAVSQEDGAIYFLTKGDSTEIYAVDFSAGTVASVLQTDETWVDLVAYANRVYILRPTTDAHDGQVLRSQRTGSDFEEPEEWIDQRTVDFSEAVSVTIDGTIFILNKDGEISRFSSGSEVGWTSGVVDPPLTVASKIWTDAESDFVYVLESETKRVVVFEKESGEFVVQYKSESFSDLTDMVVDEEDYSIYLLAGSKLYSIAASHIDSN